MDKAIEGKVLTLAMSYEETQAMQKIRRAMLKLTPSQREQIVQRILIEMKP